MTPRAGDPRTQRTVSALRAALRGLLRDRPLDEITVADLCRAADVRRTTFYTHFVTVPELLTDMLTSEIDEQLGLAETATMTLAELADGFQRTLVNAFEVVADHRELFRAGLSATTSSSLRQALLIMFEQRMAVAIAIWKSHDAADNIDEEVATVFAAGGLTAMLTGWALSSEDDATRWADSTRSQMPPWWPRPPFPAPKVDMTQTPATDLTGRTSVTYSVPCSSQ